MRRTIKQQPMSLLEISERKGQAEQRIHAADGLVATAEERLEELRIRTEAQRIAFVELENSRCIVEQSIKKSEELLNEMKKQILSVQGELTTKRNALTELEVEAATLEVKMDMERDAHAKAIKEELAALVAAREKARAEFEVVARAVEEKRVKAQKLSETSQTLDKRRAQIELEIASLEPKRSELATLNQTILERQSAIVSISDDYSRAVSALSAQKQMLVEAKRETAHEKKNAEEVRKQLSVEKAEVTQLIAQQRAIQENLESLRQRMIRAEKDAEARAFLNRGY